MCLTILWTLGVTGLASMFIRNQNTEQKNCTSGLVLLSMKKTYSNSTISGNHCAEKLKFQTNEFLVNMSNLAKN